MPDNSTCLNYPTRADESVYFRNSPRLAARIFTLLGLLTMTCAAPGIRAQGLYRDGVGARSVSLGGADVAYAIDPLGAMTSNPAGLALLSRPQLDVDLGFVSANGDFERGVLRQRGLQPGHMGGVTFEEISLSHGNLADRGGVHLLEVGYRE